MRSERKILLIAIIGLLSNCKIDNPSSAAKEYCNCINDDLEQDFKLWRNPCLNKVKNKYPLLKRFYDNQYNDRMDTINVEERRAISEFGFTFVDLVDKNCGDTGWRFGPDSLQNNQLIIYSWISSP